MISLQILRLIPLSQIWKYHGCTRPQITNPHFLYVKSAKISNPQTFWFIKSANWKSTNHPKMKHLFSKVRSLNQSIFMLYLGAGKLYFRRFPVFESAIANPKTWWFKKFVEVADLLQMFKFLDPIFWQYFKTFEKKLTIIGHKSLPNLRICGISRLEHKEICGLTIKIFRFAISTQLWAHVNIFLLINVARLCMQFTPHAPYQFRYTDYILYLGIVHVCRETNVEECQDRLVQAFDGLHKGFTIHT
jgi:hypothetical protein